MPFCVQFIVPPPTNDCSGFPALYFFVRIEQQGPDAVLHVTVNTFTPNPVPPMVFNVSYTQGSLAYYPGQPQTGTLTPDQATVPVTVPSGYTMNTFEVIIGLRPNLNTPRLSNGKYRLFYKGVVTYPCNGRGVWDVSGAEYQP